MGLFDDIEKYFSTRCLYTVLGVEKDCDEKQLKKAYYLSSLKHHPDRAQDDEDKEETTGKFQALSAVYEVLTNPEHRTVYDETGELVSEGDVLAKDKDWEAYWRLLFKKISKKDIEEFEKEYKGSVAEKDDVKKFYLKFEGNMDEIMSHVMCANYDEEDRIREVIQNLIDNDEVEEFDAFTHEQKTKKRKRMKKGEREEKEAEQHAKDIGLNTNGSLEELILKRNADRGKEFGDMISNLEAKYAKKPKSATKAKKKGRK